MNMLSRLNVKEVRFNLCKFVYADLEQLLLNIKEDYSTY